MNHRIVERRNNKEEINGTDRQLRKTGTSVSGTGILFSGNRNKKSQTIKDKYIPMILGVMGILLCGIYVLASSQISSVPQLAMAVFVSITQGILVAGLSTYVNQLLKQAGKEE